MQIHSWGASVEDSFTNAAYALYDYMTDRQAVQPPLSKFVLCVNGDDGGGGLGGLLVAFLDELLFRFVTEPFMVAREIHIDRLDPVAGILEATW